MQNKDLPQEIEFLCFLAVNLQTLLTLFESVFSQFCNVCFASVAKCVILKKKYIFFVKFSLALESQ